MKKRVLSLFMALALCLTMLPTAAFAELAGAAAEGPQSGADVSGVYTVGEDTAAQGKETDETVQAAQALIDALPDEVTAESAETIAAQLAAIDEALAALTEEQAAALDMARYETLCGALTALTAEQAAHSHPICADAACTETSHQIPDGAAWQPIGTAAELTGIKTAGYYYLTEDIETADIWTPADGMVLCLSGHSITNGGPGYTIMVRTGYTFTLCDCKGDRTEYGKITHGEQSDGTKYAGQGVYVVGTFNMYGGSIADNNSNGVALYNDVYQEGTVAVFNMYGGEITGNTAGSGAGVDISRGAFRMYGGSITGNTAQYNGGGVTAGDFTVSGNVNISGNKNANGAANNVYLPSGRTITIGEGGLGSSASIGVTAGTMPAVGGSVGVAAGASNGYTEGTIFSDTGDPYTTLRADDEVRLYNGLPHQHPICGAVCRHLDADGTPIHPVVTWTGVSTLDNTMAEGCYYLTDDVNMDKNGGAWSPQSNMTLCLGGHSITASAFANVINVKAGRAVTLCDCDAQGRGSVTNTEHNYGHGVYLNQGTLNLYGGIITGREYGVNMAQADSVFNMYGGTIKNSGTGVYMTAKGNLSFLMTGGTITGNGTGSEDGGGVYVGSGTFRMSGSAKITNNNKSERIIGGGGVCIVGGTFEMGGSAEISGNSITIKEGNNNFTSEGAGGVYVRSGTFQMSDNARITGNSVINNSSKGVGGGVYVASKGSMSVSGTVNITGNTVTNSGKDADGNVYLPDGKYFTIGTEGLTENAKIGVTSGAAISLDDYVIVATGANNGYTEGSVFSDAPAPYDTMRKDGYVRLYNGLPHQHPDCGDKTCTSTFHTNNSVWKAVSTEAELKAIAEKGSCYLANDIELTSTYTPKDGVHLCLNGYSLIATGNFDTITLPDCDNANGLSLDVCDCNASGNGNAKITHAAGKTGRGVYVGIGANFELYGGSITGNHVNGNGGGIYAKGVNFVDMSTGASITGNSATGNGGGVMLTGSSFNNGNGYGSAYFCTESSGGTISDNTAGGNGGGVYISGLGVGSSFAPRNVTVTGNKAAKGGGVYVSSTGRLSPRGATQITGNENTEGAADNVYLVDGKTIGFWSGLDDGAVIGVTTEKKLANGGYAVIADGDGNIKTTLTETDLNAFTSDDGYGKLLKDNKIFFTTGELHEHGICGATCSHETTHGNELWQPLTYDAATMTLYCGGEAVKSFDYSILAGVDENGNDKYIYYMEYRLPAGNYYLAENIALNGGTANGTTYVGGLIRTKGYDLNVNLCLNGYTLSATNRNTSLLYASMTQTLTLSDCQGGGKIQTDAGGYNVLYVSGDSNHSATFTMYGGTISGARTGVWGYSKNVINLFGGTITGNECGMEIGSNGTVTVGGTVNITGNTKQNLSLYTGGKTTAIISIDPTLTQASRIGISSSLTKDGESPIKIATGADNAALNYTQIFTADAVKDGYVVIKDGTELFLREHTHDWQYTLSADKATITVTCSNADGNCPLDGKGGSVTIKAPAGALTYNGSAREAALTNTLAAGAAEPAIAYAKQDGESFLPLADGAKPTDAGTYQASITVGGQTASVTYEIKKAAPTADDFVFTAPADLLYDGTTKNAEVQAASGINGMGTILFVRYYDDAGAALPTDARTYTVRIDVTEGDNYTAASGLTADSWAFAILPRPVTVTVNAVSREYGEENPTFTAEVTGGSLVQGDSVADLRLDLAAAATAASPAGQYDVTGSTLGNGNYAVTIKGEKKLTVTPKTLTAPDLVFTAGSSFTKVYDGTTACATATVQIKDSARVNAGDALPAVTGVYAYNSANVKDAASVTFTSARTENANYILPAGLTVTHAASITPAEQAALTLTSTAAVYGTDLTLTVSGGTGDGEVTYAVTNGTGAATVSGSTLHPTQAGTVTVTATKSGGDNYHDVSTTAAVTIAKAAYTGATVNRIVPIVMGRGTAQTGTLTAADFFQTQMPEGAAIVGASPAAGAVIQSIAVDGAAHTLHYVSKTDITATADEAYTVTIAAANYTDFTATLTFRPIAKETVTISGLTYADKTYDGSAIVPTGTLTVSGGKVPASELEVQYAGTGATTYSSTKAPSDAGTYQVTYRVADSNESYTGQVTYTFTIFQKDVTADMIAAIPAQPYTGSAIHPVPAVKDGAAVLTAGTDFTFGYDANTNVADGGRVTITGQGNYKGTAFRTFAISPKSISGAVITLDHDSLPYNGAAQEVRVTSVTLAGWTPALTATDYTVVSGSRATNANDSITLTIQGQGNYTGTAAAVWRITRIAPAVSDFTFTAPADLTYDGAAKNAAIRPAAGVTGMGDAAVVYYMGGKLLEGAPTDVGVYTAVLKVSEGTNYTAAELADGGWTFTILPNTAAPSVTLSGDTTYTGGQITPAVTVKIGGTELVRERDYTVAYGENKDAAAGGTVTITAKGNYGFTTVVEHFSITPKPITVTADDRSSRVGQPLAELTYRYAPALCGQDAFTGALTTAANKDAAGTYEIAQGTLALSGNYALTFVKGTYTVLPKLAQDGFRFAETSVTKTYGDGTFTVTASGEASGSTVTYASDNGAVATVDGSGRVTIHAAGTAAITATASATADHAEKQVSCTLTVNRKTLTASDLAFTAGSSFTKTYDGTKACTTATVQVRDSARVNAGDALPAVTGVYAYNSANVKDAASVTFTSARTESANYILPAGLTVTHAAGITPAEQAALTLTSTAAAYGTDLTLTVSGGTGDGEVTYAVTNGTGAATVSGSTLHPTQAGTVTVTATKSGGDNYRDVSTTAAVTIAKAAGGTLAAYQLQQKYSYLTTQTCAPDYAALPAGQTWTFRISDVTTSGAAAVDPAVTAIDVDTGAMTYRLTAGAEGDTVKWTVTVSSVNYEDFTREVILTLTGRDAQAALRVTGGTTVVYGQTLQLSAVGGSGTGAVTYRVDAARSTGEASIDAVTGLLTPVRVGTVTVIAVRAGDIDYNEVTSAPFELTITKATPTGEPKHTEITTGGRTLKDAALTLDGSTISLADGTLEWIDDAGNVLPDTTIVKANRTYRWRFTPADSNYTSLTGEIELYHKSTSGSTLIGTYYTIKATAGENGSISPAGRTSVREGGDQTFTITPDKGYAVAKVLVDGESVGAVKSYTFRNVTCDHTIKVIFMEANGNPQTGVSADVPVRQPAARGVVSAVSSDRVVSAIPSRPVETAVSLRRKDDAE